MLAKTFLFCNDAIHGPFLDFHFRNAGDRVLQNLIRIARALDVPMAELFEGV